MFILIACLSILGQATDCEAARSKKNLRVCKKDDFAENMKTELLQAFLLFSLQLCCYRTENTIYDGSSGLFRSLLSGLLDSWPSLTTLLNRGNAGEDGAYEERAHVSDA